LFDDCFAHGYSIAIQLKVAELLTKVLPFPVTRNVEPDSISKILLVKLMPDAQLSVVLLVLSN